MLSLVGVGGAGCKVVESFYRKDLISSLLSKIYSKEEGYATGVAIDTSDSLRALNMPAANRILIGSSRAKGHGTGGDVELGIKIMNEELELAMSVVRRANQEKPEAFFIVAGLGGGTGTGGFAVLADKIKKTYEVPVVGILIFPPRGEGVLYMKNAYENFDSVVKSIDGAIVLDSNVLTSRGESISKSYKIIDEAIFNVLSIVEPRDLTRITKGRVSTIGFMRIKPERISIKDILDKVFRNYVYFNADKIENMYFVAYGAIQNIYGQSFAKKWAEEKFGMDVEYIFKDDPSSKYLNIGLILSGLSNVEKVLKVEHQEEKVSSELDELLGDIKPLF
ncbi:MAG: hypothetical protein QME59_03705 [Candidatus Hydrothermarchaeota archaeon]|nr:hypothetical protein [Candidatus Hydrothermarchaeota archaeon]